MRKMDRNGQISIEFVLVLAIMLVLVLLIASYIGSESESSTVLSAARAGAMDATTNIVLLNRSATPLRVENLSTIGSGYNLTIQINISGSLSDYQNQNIINSTLTSIAAQGYTRSDAGTSDNPSDDYITTSRHEYNVAIV